MARVRLYASLTGCDEEHHDCAAGLSAASNAVAQTGSIRSVLKHFLSWPELDCYNAFFPILYRL